MRGVLADAHEEAGAARLDEGREGAGVAEGDEVDRQGAKACLVEGADELLHVLGDGGDEQAVHATVVLRGRHEVENGLIHRHGQAVLHFERQRLADLRGVGELGRVLPHEDAAVADAEHDVALRDARLGPQPLQGDGDRIAIEHLGVLRRPRRHRHLAGRHDGRGASEAHLDRAHALLGDLHRHLRLRHDRPHSSGYRPV